MRNFRIGKLRRVRCDKDSDSREALARSPPSALSRRISVAEASVFCIGFGLPMVGSCQRAPDYKSGGQEFEISSGAPLS